MIIWSIWRRRNEKLWDGLDVTCSQVVHRASLFLSDWLQAKTISSSIFPSHHSADISVWTHPPHGFYKNNIDATSFSESNLASFRMCIRDDHGVFVLGRSSWLHQRVPILEGEALGLLHAIEWVIDLEIDRFIFDMECKVVVDRLKVTTDDISELGVILSKCSSMLSLSAHFKVEFSRRLANRAAHNLAKGAPFKPNPFFYHDAPTCITSIISNEMA